MSIFQGPKFWVKILRPNLKICELECRVRGLGVVGWVVGWVGGWLGGWLVGLVQFPPPTIRWKTFNGKLVFEAWLLHSVYWRIYLGEFVNLLTYIFVHESKPSRPQGD